MRAVTLHEIWAAAGEAARAMARARRAVSILTRYHLRLRYSTVFYAMPAAASSPNKPAAAAAAAVVAVVAVVAAAAADDDDDAVTAAA